jgi:hypothetical protein
MGHLSRRLNGVSSDCVSPRKYRDLESIVLVLQYHTTCHFFPPQYYLPIGSSIISAVYPVIDVWMNGNVSIYVVPLGKPCRITGGLMFNHSRTISSSCQLSKQKAPESSEHSDHRRMRKAGIEEWFISSRRRSARRKVRRIDPRTRPSQAAARPIPLITVKAGRKGNHKKRPCYLHEQ